MPPATETRPGQEGQKEYFNEYEKDLLEKDIPENMRIQISDQMNFKRAGSDLYVQKDFATDNKLTNFKGELNWNGGVICFVDRNGNAWLTGDSQTARQSLKRAGYSPNEKITVPLSDGEELNNNIKDPLLEGLGNKLDRIRSIARNERNAAEQKEAEDEKAKFFAGTSL